MKKQNLKKQILAGGTAIWMGITTGWCDTIPETVADAFRQWKPNTGKMELVAAAQTNTANYYVVWGHPQPKDGQQSDSSYVDEGAFKEDAFGKVDRINGNQRAIPAENFTKEPALAQAINGDFVRRRIETLGGREAAQKFLTEKTFITEPEAQAWTNAGFALGKQTKIVDLDGKPPFRQAGVEPTVTTRPPVPNQTSGGNKENKPQGKRKPTGFSIEWE
jgi:hypothetical protein